MSHFSFSISVVYVAITDGDCISNGMEYILTQEECANAGRDVGMTDNENNRNPPPNGNRPKYCGTYYTWLHFNSQTTGTLGGHSIRQTATSDIRMICKCM